MITYNKPQSENKLSICCPQCGANDLHLVTWQTILKVLKERSWHVCNSCNYERQVEDLKREMCCI